MYRIINSELTKTKLYIFFLLVYATAFTQTAPNLIFTDMEGKTHNLYEYLDEGKSVLLDFFITDCIPCQDGAKYMNEFWNHHGPQGSNQIETLSIEVSPNSDQVVSETASLWQMNNPVINLDDIPDSYLPFVYAYPNYIMVCPNRSMSLLSFGFAYPLSVLEWEQALNTCHYGYDYADISLFDFEVTQCENYLLANLEVANIGLKPVDSIYVDVFYDHTYTETLLWNYSLLPLKTTNETLQPIFYENNLMEGSKIHFEVRTKNDANPFNNGKNHNKLSTKNQNITIEIQTDYFPEEISWSLVDANGNIVTEGYGSDYQPYELIQIQVELDTSLCHSFIINDEFGDGICCSLNGGYYPDGYYMLKSESDTLVYNDSFLQSKVDAFYVEDAESNEIGLEEIDETLTILAEEYYNLKGQQIEKPTTQGVFIQKVSYTDGSSAYKKLIKTSSK